MKDSQGNPEASQINQRVFDTISTILVSLMMACVAITLTLFSQKLMPIWGFAYLPVFSTLVAIERLITNKQIKRLVFLSKRWFVFHTTQWVVILIILKILQVLSQKPESLWMEIQLWRLDFFSNFFDTGFSVAISFVVSIWFLSGYFAGLLDEMSLEETLIRYETAVIAPVEGLPARERLLNAIFGVGFILVILTAILRVNLRMLFSEGIENFEVLPLPILAAGAWNVLLYFLFGLVLMSQTQFARLNARWHFYKVPVGTRLAGHWVAYSLIFILLLALLASALPTQYSFGFLSIVAYLLKLLFGIMLFCFGFLWTILTFLINQLTILLGLNQQQGGPLPIQGYEPPALPPEVIPHSGYPWLEMLKSILFWTIFITVVAFSVIQFLRQHQGLWSSLQSFPGLSWLTRLWDWLTVGFKGLNQKISEVVESSVTRLRARRKRLGASQGGRFINLGKLNPRQRVFFFFLAMIRRGGEKGIPRRSAQTPYEYAATLEDTLPEVDEEVASITEAFVEARYSRQDVDDSQAGRVKRYWERIRGALRSFRK